VARCPHIGGALVIGQPIPRTLPARSVPCAATAQQDTKPLRDRTFQRIGKNRTRLHAPDPRQPVTRGPQRATTLVH
jgi:hypothetical protein